MTVERKHITAVGSVFSTRARVLTFSLSRTRKPLLFTHEPREREVKMVQRLTYRKRHSYATKSNQHRVVKTPGIIPNLSLFIFYFYFLFLRFTLHYCIMINLVDYTSDLLSSNSWVPISLFFLYLCCVNLIFRVLVFLFRVLIQLQELFLRFYYGLGIQLWSPLSCKT